MKRDLLGECNSDKEPLSDFTQKWCSRCLTPECARSLHGTAKFDQRVVNWRERLFSPQRLPDSDPRREGIQAQNFQLLMPSTPRVGSDWTPPEPAESKAAESKPATPKKAPTPEPATPSEPPAPKKKPSKPKKKKTRTRKKPATPAEEPQKQMPEPAEKKPPSKKQVPAANTQDPGPQMLPGAPSTPTREGDAWGARKGTVKPGARIKLGGGS
jgi:hypothetical protein